MRGRIPTAGWTGINIDPRTVAPSIKAAQALIKELARKLPGGAKPIVSTPEVKVFADPATKVFQNPIARAATAILEGIVAAGSTMVSVAFVILPGVIESLNQDPNAPGAPVPMAQQTPPPSPPPETPPPPPETPPPETPPPETPPQPEKAVADSLDPSIPECTALGRQLKAINECWERKINEGLDALGRPRVGRSGIIPGSIRPSSGPKENPNPYSDSGYNPSGDEECLLPGAAPLAAGGAISGNGACGLILCRGPGNSVSSLGGACCGLSEREVELTSRCMLVTRCQDGALPVPGGPAGCQCPNGSAGTGGTPPRPGPGPDPMGRIPPATNTSRNPASNSDGRAARPAQNLQQGTTSGTQQRKNTQQPLQQQLRRQQQQRQGQ